MKGLRLIYALICALWATYVIRTLMPFQAHGTSVAAAALAVLLTVVLPEFLGYLLVFKAVPRIARSARR